MDPTYDGRTAIMTVDEDGTWNIVEIHMSQESAQQFLAQLPPLIASLFQTVPMRNVRVTVVS